VCGPLGFLYPNAFSVPYRNLNLVTTPKDVVSSSRMFEKWLIVIRSAVPIYCLCTNTPICAVSFHAFWTVQRCATAAYQSFPARMSDLTAHATAVAVVAMLAAATMLPLLCWLCISSEPWDDDDGGARPRPLYARTDDAPPYAPDSQAAALLRARRPPA